MSAHEVVALADAWTALRERVDTHPSDPVARELFSELLDIEERMIATPASSLWGVLAKLRVVEASLSEYLFVDMLRSAILDLTEIAGSKRESAE